MQYPSALLLLPVPGGGADIAQIRFPTDQGQVNISNIRSLMIYFTTPQVASGLMKES
jgi:hypothetical protein